MEPEVARVFPNDKAVNEALSGLIQIAEATARPVPRKVGTRTVHGKAEVWEQRRGEEVSGGHTAGGVE